MAKWVRLGPNCGRVDCGSVQGCFDKRQWIIIQHAPCVVSCGDAISPYITVLPAGPRPPVVPFCPSAPAGPAGPIAPAGPVWFAVAATLVVVVVVAAALICAPPGDDNSGGVLAVPAAWWKGPRIDRVMAAMERRKLRMSAASVKLQLHLPACTTAGVGCLRSG